MNFKTDFSKNWSQIYPFLPDISARNKRMACNISNSFKPWKTRMKKIVQNI